MGLGFIGYSMVNMVPEIERIPAEYRQIGLNSVESERLTNPAMSTLERPRIALSPIAITLNISKSSSDVSMTSCWYLRPNLLVSQTNDRAPIGRKVYYFNNIFRL